ncbi:MAG TPA: hypothetical protein DEP61_05840 [Lachnospiraceae bacterium]|nr:hypothetical protein [Lachnospiraceae bacterium]
MWITGKHPAGTGIIHRAEGKNGSGRVRMGIAETGGMQANGKTGIKQPGTMKKGREAKGYPPSK